MTKQTKTEFSEAMGFSRSYTSKLLRQKKITADANGLIDLETSAAAIGKFDLINTDNGDDPEGMFQPTANKRELERQKLFEQGRKLKIENDEKAGRLVNKGLVADQSFNVFRNFRDKLQAIPARLSPRLVGKKKHTIERALIDEIHKALTELTTELQETTVPDIEDRIQFRKFHKKILERTITQMFTDYDAGKLTEEEIHLMALPKYGDLIKYAHQPE